jgi:hypothetical protein
MISAREEAQGRDLSAPQHSPDRAERKRGREIRFCVLLPAGYMLVLSAARPFDSMNVPLRLLLARAVPLPTPAAAHAEGVYQSSPVSTSGR